MKDKWRARIREGLKEDANRIMEEVNSDSSLKDVEAPEEIHEKLMQQIHEYENAKNPVDERLTAEERELIQLGKVYKKTRKVYRYAAVAAAVIMIVAVGITSFGGPQKVIRIVRDFVNSRERTNVDIDKERIDDVQAKGEYEAYLEIEEIFKTKAVGLSYLPNGLDFFQCNIDEEIQNAQLYYEDGKDRVLSYNIWFNYRSASTGVDVEDDLIQDYVLDIEGHKVLIKQYEVEDGNTSRWRAEFEHQKVHYFLEISGLKRQEVEKIVKNLHFY